MFVKSIGQFVLVVAIGCSWQVVGLAQQKTETTKSGAEADDGTRLLPTADDPVTDEEEPMPVEVRLTRGEIAAKAFAPPPGAKSISPRNLWIDTKKSIVVLDGYVAVDDGALEMFACPTGTKEHESVVATIAKSSEVHAALLAISAKPGTTVRFLPRYVPATGQRIRVWVCYRDKDGKFQAVDGRKWVQKAETGTSMDVDWVFAGSGFWTDPSDNREYYRADSGDMICVSNFSSAMLDIPVASSADASQLDYTPMTKVIPKRGTPVRLVLMPIPVPTDTSDGKVKEIEPPTEEILPAAR
ncbi:MAG: YdjY domain-containing protein [Rubripirellula sp.]